LAPILGNPFPRRLSVAGTDAPGIRIDIELLESTITVDQTARIRVNWTNERSERLVLRLSNSGASPDLQFTPERTGVVLVPSSYGFTGQTWAGCWKLTQVSGNAGQPYTRLDSGQTLTHEYEVWTDRDEEGCFPLGQHRFGDINIGPDDMNGMPMPEWAFTLTIEDA
jgi:hypothetical protein